ncbi:MAG: helix-turn-helix transcriptional regulator [Peptostreptococcales bacterium]
MNEIQKKRIKNGMSQEQLAELLGIDRSTIAKWETGVSFPRGEKLPDLARILNCSIDDLFNRENKERDR